MKRITLLCWLVMATAASGYGGFGFSASYADLGGLDRMLSRLNREEAGGSGAFALSQPLWSVFGQGGGHAAWFTVAGTGALFARVAKADALKSEMVGVSGWLEGGYPYAPLEWFWVRPTVDLGGTGWYGYAHSLDRGFFPGAMKAKTARKYFGWVAGVAPGLEVMGRIRSGRTSFFGLFVKGSWFIPAIGPQCYGNAGEQDFTLSGFSVTAGVRFGRISERPLHI
jgi:hypothetical protein